MIQNSSKRLAKIKKKLRKHDATDYHFLISSLERQNNKENIAFNKKQSSNMSSTIFHNKTSMKQSVELIKPSKSMIKSFDNYNLLKNKQDHQHCSKIQIKNSNLPFFENVKFLNNSRVQPEIPQPKYDVSRYRKNIEFSHERKSKIIKQSAKCDKSNKFTQNLTDSYEQKLQTFIEFVNQLLEQLILNEELSILYKLQRKKCIIDTLTKQLLRQNKKYSEQSKLKNMNQSVEVSNFCSFASKTINHNQAQKQKEQRAQNTFKKIIDSLSHENNKLTQLVSQHERQNIKMFIQINESESKQLQKCKKYLSSLYDKYKILQKFILKENEKYKKLNEEKKQLENKLFAAERKNSDLTHEIQTIKEKLAEYLNRTASKLSFQQESSNTIFNFNLNEINVKNPQKRDQNKNNISVCQNSNIEKPFITKREKASSCLDNHQCDDIRNKSEAIMSCSTVTKTKNMKKKKFKDLQNTKQNIGINLKEQFSKSDLVQCLGVRQMNKRTKQTVKASLTPCNSTQIQNLKDLLEKQMSQSASIKRQLDFLSKSMSKKQQKMERMQNIINQQIEEIQKLMRINRKVNKERECLEKYVSITSQVNKCTKSIKQKSLKNKSPNDLRNEQYKIIALQANAIEGFINFS